MPHFLGHATVTDVGTLLGAPIVEAYQTYVFTFAKSSLYAECSYLQALVAHGKGATLIKPRAAFILEGGTHYHLASGECDVYHFSRPVH